MNTKNRIKKIKDSIPKGQYTKIRAYIKSKEKTDEQIMTLDKFLRLCRQPDNLNINDDEELFLISLFKPYGVKSKDDLYERPKVISPRKGGLVTDGLLKQR